MAENEISTFEFNPWKILLIIILSVSVISLAWYSFNVPSVFQIAQPYLVLIIASVALFGLAFSIGAKWGGDKFFKPLLHESDPLGGRLKIIPKWMWLWINFTIPAIFLILLFF